MEITPLIQALSASAGIPPVFIKALSASAGSPPVFIKALSASAGILPAPIKALSASAGIPPVFIKALSASAGILPAPMSAGIPPARAYAARKGTGSFCEAKGACPLFARPLARSRRGFTLVELLVVIGIIAVLAAIITPAVMRAQASARNAAIKAEIDMLHMAIMNYKNEYGSFPPCISSTASGDWAAKHILRLFPRTLSITNEVQGPVTPANAIVGWLEGYSNDPTRPVSAGNRSKLFDFDRSRLDTTRSIYFPSGKAGSPYIYINSGVYTTGTWPSATVSYSVGSQSYSIPANAYAPVIRATVPSVEYFNPDTFQILCAGRDEQFGNDDDLSNFWPGTRRDYQDSLNQ